MQYTCCLSVFIDYSPVFNTFTGLPVAVGPVLVVLIVEAVDHHHLHHLGALLDQALQTSEEVFLQEEGTIEEGTAVDVVGEGPLICDEGNSQEVEVQSTNHSYGDPDQNPLKCLKLLC